MREHMSPSVSDLPAPSPLAASPVLHTDTLKRPHLPRVLASASVMATHAVIACAKIPACVAAGPALALPAFVGVGLGGLSLAAGAMARLTGAPSAAHVGWLAGSAAMGWSLGTCIALGGAVPATVWAVVISGSLMTTHVLCAKVGVPAESWHFVAACLNACAIGCLSTVHAAHAALAATHAREAVAAIPMLR
jgi:hypothetical protein